MKKLFTAEEVRNIASGAFAQGYLSVFDEDLDVNPDNLSELDFMIEQYANTRSENEGRICILS